MRPEQKETFWLVWAVDSGRPTQRHDSFNNASSEAKRLARANTGTEFVVLEAKAGFRISEPLTEIVYDPLPF